MPSSRFDEERDYSFADQVLALRHRAGLIQRELAVLLGVSDKTIRKWEAGLSYPAPEHLQQLIALALDREAFTVGREDEEAARLWETVRAKAPRRAPPFDRHWFASLRPAERAGVLDVPSPLQPAPAPEGGRHDWGEAPDVPALHDRSQELSMLARWVDDERGRVVVVLGAGGIGKTTLVAWLAQERAPTFPIVYWRSLRNALPVEEWLGGAITALSVGQALPPEGVEARLALVLELLRTQRALLVLDNLETVLEPEEPLVRYRPGYEGYGEVLRRLGTSAHQGFIVLASREQPLRSHDAAVHSLHLGGLAVEDGRALLGRRNLVGDAASWKSLVERYGGNPLALGVVGETIAMVFGGDIAAFLAQEVTVFGGIRQLLDEQITRLSPLEHAVLLWLAVEREPVGFGDLVADLGPSAARGEVVEAVEALQRRCLLERGGQSAFTLQPVVLEYATTHLVNRVYREVAAHEPVLLVSHALVKAQAKDYVRRSQERLIGQPLLAQLRTQLGGAEAVEQRLLALLEAWRGHGVEEQGYGPGNTVNLLRLLRGDLRGLDLSHLFIRQAYLQEVDAQDASLAGSELFECALADAFDICPSVAFSPDGRHLAAGTLSGELCVWRLADWTRTVSTQGHKGIAYGIDWASDGRLLATGGLDATVKLWEAKGGRHLLTLEGHAGLVWDVSFSKDSQLVASGSHDGTVKLWESSTGRVLQTLQGHKEAMWSVALSDDGSMVASSSTDGTVKLWEAANGSLLTTLEGDAGPVYDVTFTPDGRLVAGGGHDGLIRLWEVATGRLESSLRGHTQQIWSLAMSADDHLLISGSLDGTLRLWDLASAACLTALEAHASAVTGVAISPDGRLCASASQDGTLRLWEVPSGKPVTTLQGYARGTWGLSWDGSGRLLASGTQDGTINLWDVPSGALHSTLRGHTGVIYGVVFSEDGQMLATSSQDSTIRLWQLADGACLTTIQSHTGTVPDVVLDADGRVLIGSGQDGMIRLWHVAAGELLATIQAHTGHIWSIGLSADGRLLASGSQDGTVKLWEIPSGQLLATMRDDGDLFWGLALSRNGKLVASGGQSGRVNLWEAPTGRLLAVLGAHGGPVWGLDFSPDTRLLVSGGADAMVMLWDVESHRLIARCTGHAGRVNDVAVSPDGRLIASSSQDGAVMLWDSESGAHRATLRPDRRYERMDITELTGVSEVQKVVLKTLGAVERRP
jgi:WD40 repeat protein/transcriptional regulator with XRE-family HTH domain